MLRVDGLFGFDVAIVACQKFTNYITRNLLGVALLRYTIPKPDLFGCWKKTHVYRCFSCWLLVILGDFIKIGFERFFEGMLFLPCSCYFQFFGFLSKTIPKPQTGSEDILLQTIDTTWRAYNNYMAPSTYGVFDLFMGIAGILLTGCFFVLHVLRLFNFGLLCRVIVC